MPAIDRSLSDCRYHSNKGVVKLPAGPHELMPLLRIEIWDENRVSPDDLIVQHSLEVDLDLLEEMAQPGGMMRWLLLELMEGVPQDTVCVSCTRSPHHGLREDLSERVLVFTGQDRVTDPPPAG